MYVEDVEDRSNTPKGCNAIYVEDVEDRSNTPKGCNAIYVEYTQYWMVWLESPKSQLSKTFCGLKIG